MSSAENEFDAVRKELIEFSEFLHAKSSFSVATLLPLLTRQHQPDVRLDPRAMDAAARIAAFIDHHPEYHHPLYHNVAHYMEVAWTAFVFARLEAARAGVGRPSTFLSQNGIWLTREDISDCFIAGLIHDLGHPGGNNNKPGDQGKGGAFYLEEKSWALAEPLLRQAGYSDTRLARLKAMVMASEPDYAVPIVEKMLDYHTDRQSAGPTRLLEIAREAGTHQNSTLDRLVNSLRDPKLTMLCYLFNKADLTYSLLPETYLSRLRALHDEWHGVGVGIPLIDANRMPIVGAATHFFNKTAFVRDPFPLDSIEYTIGASARQLSGGQPGNGVEPQRPTPGASGGTEDLSC
jgi:hypothetical protein